MRQRRIDKLSANIREVEALVKQFSVTYPSDPSKILYATVHTVLARTRLELNVLDDYYRRKELEREGL